MKHLFMSFVIELHYGQFRFRDGLFRIVRKRAISYRSDIFETFCFERDLIHVSII